MLKVNLHLANIVSTVLHISQTPHISQYNRFEPTGI